MPTRALVTSGHFEPALVNDLEIEQQEVSQFSTNHLQWRSKESDGSDVGVPPCFTTINKACHLLTPASYWHTQSYSRPRRHAATSGCLIMASFRLSHVNFA